MKEILLFTILHVSYISGDLLPSLENPKDYYSYDIERPCDVSSVECIRDFFAEHSRCLTSRRRVPDPLYRRRTSIVVRKLNLNITMTDIIYNGLNGVIEDFCVNRDTNEVILAVTLNNLMMTSENATFTYYRRARDPIVNMAYFRIRASSITLTITIPNIQDMQLQYGKVYAYLNSTNLNFDIGAEAFQTVDPVIFRAYEKINRGTTALIRPTLTDTAFDIINFIQYSICYFGLKFV